MLSSYRRTASETKPGLKFTMTIPPVLGTSLRIESGTSRAWPVSARAEECENMTGARVVWSASDIVASLTWERSTTRSEEHTSELQSLTNLVCRLLLEKKKKRDHRRGLKATRERTTSD